MKNCLLCTIAFSPPCWSVLFKTCLVTRGTADRGWLNHVGRWVVGSASLVAVWEHSDMIGQKLILPTRVQAEIDEVALLYAPVLLLILTHFRYLLVGVACIFYHNFYYPRKFANRGSENLHNFLTLKVKNRVHVLGIKKRTKKHMFMNSIS